MRVWVFKKEVEMETNQIEQAAVSPYAAGLNGLLTCTLAMAAWTTHTKSL
jgi:hypothetical protein